MTLPFDMEVYTKQLVRSNSHNVGEPGKQFNKLSINQFRRNLDMSESPNLSNAIPITKSIYLFLS